jgi:hypothetical protein
MVVELCRFTALRADVLFPVVFNVQEHLSSPHLQTGIRHDPVVSKSKKLFVKRFKFHTLIDSQLSPQSSSHSH